MAKTAALLLLLLLAPYALLDVHAMPSVNRPPPQQRRLRSKLTEICSGVRAICEFVVANCDQNGPQALDPKCIESFQEYARDSDVFKSCEDQAATDSSGSSSGSGGERASAVSLPLQLHRFKELYSSWQQAHVCEIFHATEKKAAHACAGDNVHRPWNADTWPLFCHQTFTNYKVTRHEIEALCERTADSEAFWEGYVDYIASSTCKQYYDFVRSAAKHDCAAANAHDAKCVKMFEWYQRNQREIEVDCFELHNTKPFYKGFYKWKAHQH